MTTTTPTPALADLPGAHHLTPENIEATIKDLRAIEDGSTPFPIQHRDMLTQAGVWARIIEHLARRAAQPVAPVQAEDEAEADRREREYFARWPDVATPSPQIAEVAELPKPWRDRVNLLEVRHSRRAIVALDYAEREIADLRDELAASRRAAIGDGRLNEALSVCGTIAASDIGAEGTRAALDCISGIRDLMAAPAEGAGQAGQVADAALERAAKIAENFGPSRPIATPRPSEIIKGRWEGEQAASSTIAALIRGCKYASTERAAAPADQPSAQVKP